MRAALRKSPERLKSVDASVEDGIVDADRGSRCKAELGTHENLDAARPESGNQDLAYGRRHWCQPTRQWQRPTC